MRLIKTILTVFNNVQMKIILLMKKTAKIRRQVNINPICHNILLSVKRHLQPLLHNINVEIHNA